MGDEGNALLDGYEPPTIYITKVDRNTWVVDEDGDRKTYDGRTAMAYLLGACVARNRIVSVKRAEGVD